MENAYNWYNDEEEADHVDSRGIKYWFLDAECPHSVAEPCDCFDYHREAGPAVVWPDGSYEWWHEGHMMRRDMDGPTVWHTSGYEEWRSGLDEVCGDGTYLHNECGPALIRHDGTKEYYIFGHLHREDGPAVINPDGTCKYYLDGKQNYHIIGDTLITYMGYYNASYGTWRYLDSKSMHVNHHNDEYGIIFEMASMM